MSVERIKSELESIFDVSVIHDTFDVPHVDGQKERKGPAQFCQEYDIVETKGDVIHAFYMLHKGRTHGPALAILSVGDTQLGDSIMSDEMIAEGMERIECAKIGVKYHLKGSVSPEVWQDMKDKARKAESKGEA